MHTTCRFSYGILIVLVAFWLVGCTGQGPATTPASLGIPAPTPTAGPLSLVVLHTNDTEGELEPCG